MYTDGRLFRWHRLNFEPTGELNTVSQQAFQKHPAGDTLPKKEPEEIQLKDPPSVHVPLSTLSADARRYASIEKNNKVRVWDLTPGGKPDPLMLKEVPDKISVLALAETDGLLALGTSTKLQVRRSEPATSADEVLRELDLQKIYLAEKVSPDRRVSHPRDVFSADAQWLATNIGGLLVLWQWEEARAFVLSQVGDVWALVFAEDRQRQLLIVGYRDGTIRIWNVRDVAATSAPGDAPPKPMLLKGHDGPITSLTASGDGSHLLSTSTDGTARVWTLSLEPLVNWAKKLIKEANSPRPSSAALPPDD